MSNLLDVRAIIQEIESCQSLAELESLRIRYLGRSGSLTEALRQLKAVDLTARREAGAKLNQAKKTLTAAIARQQVAIQQQVLQAESEQPIDLTAPTNGHQLGHYHPVREVEKDLILALNQLGFMLADGPEIETEWYNFEALNIPADHPARDMFDTFYVDKDQVLRTHTSPVQIRHMEKQRPPIRLISVGRVYRNEDEDATHLAVFRQIEGLVIDKNINLADLKGTLLYMFKAVLGKDVKIKLLPSYFPFVEPALEVHISCQVCGGRDDNCRTCKGVGWIEMCGAGMVHPQVLKNVGIDPVEYSGFAFGAGIDRITAVKHQVPDIRYFYRPDVRFIKQFK